MIEYKIISESSIWSMRSIEKAIERRINDLTKDGWRLVSLSFSYGYHAHATLARDTRNTNDLG